MAPPPTSAAHKLGDAKVTPPAKKLKTTEPVIAATGGEDWRVNLRGDLELTTPRADWWWTALAPPKCPGWQPEGKHLSALPLPNLSTVTREQTLEYFQNTWATTETLFSALQGEEPFYRLPYHELRHPLIFYYGHPAVFYINKLRVAGMIKAGINEHFESIFEVGVDEMSWDDLSKNDMEWPSVREVNNYRRAAYAVICDVIKTHSALDALPINQASPAWCIHMAFEHEKIHIETSSVLMRELPVHLVEMPPYWPPYHPSAMAWAGAAGSSPPMPSSLPVNSLVTVPAGDIIVGKPYDWPSYGWDNEYGERKMHIRQFRATKFLVSNAEFYQFVKAGGYRMHKYWTKDGWNWRTFRNAKWPTFWVPDGPEGLHQYKLRLCFDVVAMAWTLPADVNWHEAHAYCAWLSERDGLEAGAYRILSEGEHQRVKGVGGGMRPAVDPVMGDAAVLGAAHNLGLRAGSANAVDALPANTTGFHDATGSVWQWCSDHFAALPGYKVHPMYDDFSTPCFDGQHNIIMGGSWVSAGDLASVFARFHFRPHFFQHAGFRVVRSDHAPLLTSMDAPPPYAAGWVPPSSDPSKQVAVIDNTAVLISQQLQQHYAEDTALLAGPGVGAFSGLGTMSQFPARAAAALLDTYAAAVQGAAPVRALDIGCGVGGGSFALARTCNEVVGLDQNAAVVAAANSMRNNGHIELFRQEEGELGKLVKVHVSAGVDRERVSFKQMDAMCLSPALGEFDVVLVSNLIEFLISPMACLGRLGGKQGVVRVGGLVLIASTFAWNAQLTPQDLWLGGNKNEDGKEVWSRDGLATAMGSNFELVKEEDLPLLSRVNARKYEVQLSNVTIWRRVA